MLAEGGLLLAKNRVYKFPNYLSFARLQFTYTCIFSEDASVFITISTKLVLNSVCKPELTYSPISLRTLGIYIKKSQNLFRESYFLILHRLLF